MAYRESNPIVGAPTSGGRPQPYTPTGARPTPYTPGGMSPQTNGTQGSWSDHKQSTMSTPNRTSAANSGITTKSTGWGDLGSTKKMTNWGGATKGAAPAPITPQTPQGGAVSKMQNMNVQPIQPMAQEPVDNSFNFQSSPYYEVAKAGLDQAMTKGNVAQNARVQQAKQQAAMAGIDPNSPAYRKLISEASDAGSQAMAGMQEGAMDNYKDLMVRAFEQGDQKALQMLQMLDLSQEGQTAVAQGIMGGKSIAESSSDLFNEGQLKEGFEAGGYWEQAMDDTVQQMGVLYPDASPEEIQQMASDQMSRQLEVEQATATDQVESHDLQQRLEAGEIPAVGDRAAWAEIQTDEVKKGMVTQASLGDWWNSYEHFDDKYGAGGAKESDVEAKIRADGITEGSYMQTEDGIREVVSMGVKRVGTRANPKMEATIVVRDPGTGQLTPAITKTFDKK